MRDAVMMILIIAAVLLLGPVAEQMAMVGVGVSDAADRSIFRIYKNSWARTFSVATYPT